MSNSICHVPWSISGQCARSLGEKTGPNPTDQRKAGFWHQLITDAFGEPLAATLTGANAHYLTQQPPLVVAIAQVGGRAVCPAPIRCESSLTAPLTRALQQASAERCVKSWRWLAWRRLSHLTGLGALRWVVERTIAWLHQFLRLRLRYKKRADIDAMVLAMSCCLICF